MQGPSKHTVWREPSYFGTLHCSSLCSLHLRVFSRDLLWLWALGWLGLASTGSAPLPLHFTLSGSGRDPWPYPYTSPCLHCLAQRHSLSCLSLCLRGRSCNQTTFLAGGGAGVQWLLLAASHAPQPREQYQHQVDLKLLGLPISFW